MVIYCVHVEEVSGPLDSIANPVIPVLLINLVIFLRYLVP